MSNAASIYLSKAQFLTSAAQPHGFPPDDCPEVAFAGRSNAGKSSALNALCGRRKLARISKTPGRTQLINFFALENATPPSRLVDLPGYGYAKVPPKVRAQWQGLIENYLQKRKSLQGIVLIMDCRHPLTEFDQQMLAWGKSSGLQFHVLMTKADKLSRGRQQAALLPVARALHEHSVQLFSATSKQGVDEAQAKIVQWLGLPGEPGSGAPDKAEDSVDSDARQAGTNNETG